MKSAQIKDIHVLVNSTVLLKLFEKRKYLDYAFISSTPHQTNAIMIVNDVMLEVKDLDQQSEEQGHIRQGSLSFNSKKCQTIHIFIISRLPDVISSSSCSSLDIKYIAMLKRLINMNKCAIKHHFIDEPHLVFKLSYSEREFFNMYSLNIYKKTIHPKY